MTMPGASNIDLLSRARILILDDSPFMLQLITTCLKAFNVKRAVGVDTAAEFMQHLDASAFDAAIIDWRLRESDGLDLIRTIRHDRPDPVRRMPIILCTGYSEYDRVLEARSAGIHEMLCKPVTPHELYTKLVSALTSRRPFVISEDYVGPEMRSMKRQMEAAGLSLDPESSADEIFL